MEQAASDTPPATGSGSGAEVLADGTPVRLGRYRLVRPISTGGMARVYEARRESLAGVAPRVAVKVILPEHARHQGFQRLFINEARIGSLLAHQNLVQIQDFDHQDDRYYLVMEYVEGVTLRRAISLCRRHGLPVPLSIVAEIGRQVCDGLHYAHHATAEDGSHLRLVHRDIKPSNLILNPQGVVKLLDFGISRALLTSERPGAVRGTWGYMSPEQASGVDVGPQADLFGLAAVLYELAALQPLFKEKTPDAIRPLLDADEAARRAASLTGPMAPLSGVLVRALQRDPAARFTSAAAMGRALAGLVSDPVTSRDQLVRFQQDLGARARTGAAEPRKPQHSSSTMHPTSQHTGGLPVAVGGARAPHSVVDLRAPRRGGAGGHGRLMSALPAVIFGVGLVIVGVTAWSLWADRAASDGGDDMAGAPDSLQRLVETEPAPGTDVAPEPPPLPPEEAPDPAPRRVSHSGTRVLQPVAGSAPAASGAADAAVTATGSAASAPPSTSDPSTAVPSAAVNSAAETSGSGTVSLDSVDGTDSDAASPSAAAPADPALVPVTVSSMPRATLAIDGEMRGRTPQVGLSLPPGKHTITLAADDGRRTTFTIDVVEGRSNRWIWDFESTTFK